MENELTDEQLSRYSAFISRAMGLHFSPARWPELQRGLTAAARELGAESVAGWMNSLASAPLTDIRLETLAQYLTVGETYFFRDMASFDALSMEILPALMRSAHRNRRLRIWSAACCTGEEPYSIAIQIQRTIPDWRDWNITLLATDINPRFLEKAEEGVYSDWSFRSVQPWFKERYFRPASQGRLEVLPDVRRMVQFAQLNLVDDVYPSVINNTNAFDVIFCRNVLMYFSPEQASRVVERLHRAQADDGWLIVGPNELPHAAAAAYTPVELRGAIVYQKSEAAARHHPNVGARSDQMLTSRNPLAAPSVSHRVPQMTTPIPPIPVAVDPGEAKTSALSAIARALANEGRLDESLKACEQWILAEKTDYSGHYLRAVILLEKNEVEEAIASLRRALYLAPKFILAHYALGNIARSRGQIQEADKHMGNVMLLLRDCPADEVVPESGGVTAGRFAQIVGSLTNTEARP